MKFSACIEMLFTDSPFLERPARAKAAGFDGVEFWLWKDKDLDALKAEVDRLGLEVATFQGNTEGHLIDPADHEAYCAGVMESLGAARRLGAQGLFCMTNILGEDRTVVPPERQVPEPDKEAAIVEAMKRLGPEAAKAGVTLLMEPLNTLVDHAGYHISRSSIAWDLHRRIDHPNVKVLYDIYHMQIMEGNIIETLRAHIGAVGHIHVADVPGRHEPGTGEINYANVARAIRDLGYGGYVGMEFLPTAGSEEALEETRSIFGF